MKTKEELQQRVQIINQQISQLHDEGIKIVGQLELLEQIEKEKVAVKAEPPLSL